jgi:coenzyme F420-0:L-glutamate ligase / coenzyme F420-1:gamma-L-glutamate ligase
MRGAAAFVYNRRFYKTAIVALQPHAMTLLALEGVPEVQPGQALDEVVVRALELNGRTLGDGDVVAVAQKIVSKAEGRFVELHSVDPGERAIELAQRCAKDPRFVELVLRESTEVLRCVKDVLIVRHRLGFIVANAGVDQSNIDQSQIDGSGHLALLLPENPDLSATRLRDALAHKLGVQVAVLITDSFGRPWRMGVCGTCIGCAGLVPLADMRGRPDRFGRPLRVTQIAVADELAAAATLAMGEADEGRPIVVVSGVAAEFFTAERPATDLVRPAESDLFR